MGANITADRPATFWSTDLILSYGIRITDFYHRLSTEVRASEAGD